MILKKIEIEDIETTELKEFDKDDIKETIENWMNKKKKIKLTEIFEKRSFYINR
ncbi:MAG: hypothetical protein ACFFAS_05100 [Promethearchaeota archaeon]